MSTTVNDDPEIEKTVTVALVGNPNTGKTTLFNGLTGLFQRVGNYPGVTVERKVGQLDLESGRTVSLLDLPGAYSLSALSPDETIVADVLLGRQAGEAPVSAVLAIVDATNLQRNLYLVSQILELGLPVVVALNMTDVASPRGIQIETDLLSDRMGVPVIPICASRKTGLSELRRVLDQVLTKSALTPRPSEPEFPEALKCQVAALSDYATSGGENGSVSRAEAFRGVIDEGGYAEERLLETQGEGFLDRLVEIRNSVSGGEPLSSLESSVRYRWIGTVTSGAVSHSDSLQVTLSDRVDKVLTHRILGTVIFISLMALVFQAIYAWSGPMMDTIDSLFSWIGQGVGSSMPEGALQSLLVDGVIGGVGSVVVFVPQIAILFFFLAIMEGCGYMSRAAFLMDRLLTKCGLSGKAFIPLLSSFACAVPGIMAARTIEDRRDRFATILVAPLMSCSARLPVYTIFIGAFVPDRTLLGGWFGLQGLTLFAMYSVGALVAIPTAFLLKRTILKGGSAPFILEFPSYKFPDFRTVILRVFVSCKSFLERAGTIILAAAVVMWALAYFPRPAEVVSEYETRMNSVRLSSNPAVVEYDLAILEAEMASELLNRSYLGKTGHFIEPVVRPLGWDWRIGMAALASFPAREILVATLGTIYSLGEVEESSEDLRQAMRNATWEDGRKVFSIPVALSVMVFFALCAQCTATLAVIQRETQSWRWAVFAFSYMTIFAYLGAFVVYQVTSALGWGG
jgi:ferrous iron transport protein B